MRYSLPTAIPLLSVIILTLLSFRVPDAAADGQLNEIVLRDGSVIKARVVSLDKGVYTLKSKTLGTIELREDEIAVIRASGQEQTQQTSLAPAAGTTTRQPETQPQTQEQIKDVQGSLLTNPGILTLIFDLQNDPEVQAILGDREVMALIMSGNTEALQKNEKFRRLMENPKIKKILERAKE